MAVLSIDNTELTTADTEYSITIPAGARYLTTQLRTAAVMRFAFEAGKVATPTSPYGTVKSGGSFSVSLPPHHNATLYLASPDGSVDAETVFSDDPHGG